MNTADYAQQFRDYERARQRFQEIQDDITQLLARFTGQPLAVEAPIVLADLARLEGLRAQRAEAEAAFIRRESLICADLMERLVSPR